MHWIDQSLKKSVQNFSGNNHSLPKHKIRPNTFDEVKDGSGGKSKTF
jgi:hypothetical protein